MLRALNLCQDAGNDHLSMDLGCDIHSCISFPFHRALNQVYLSTDLLDQMILTEVVIQPTEKPRSAGSRKLIPKKNRNNKKSRLEIKKFRSASEPLYGVSVDPSGDKGVIPQRLLLYTNEYKKNNPPMNIGSSVPIFSWKLTKKQSHIINDITIPGLLLYSGFSQRFNLNAESPNMSEKDIGLLYHLIERLLLVSKITRPDVHTCASYIITRMELPTNYHKGAHLNLDALFVKKTRMFALSSTDDQNNHVETLFCKHKNYILIILQQIIQLQRLKKISTVLKRVLKNMIK